MVSGKLKFLNETLKKFKIPCHIGLAVRRKLRGYFGMRKVMALQRRHLNIQQTMEIQQQSALAFVDDTKTTSSWGAFSTWVEIKAYRSVMERKK